MKMLTLREPLKLMARPVQRALERGIWPTVANDSFFFFLLFFERLGRQIGQPMPIRPYSTQGAQTRPGLLEQTTTEAVASFL